MCNKLSSKEQFIIFMHEVYAQDETNPWIDDIPYGIDFDTKIVKALKAYQEDPRFHNTVNVAINLLLQGGG